MFSVADVIDEVEAELATATLLRNLSRVLTPRTYEQRLLYSLTKTVPENSILNC